MKDLLWHRWRIWAALFVLLLLLAVARAGPAGFSAAGDGRDVWFVISEPDGDVLNVFLHQPGEPPNQIHRVIERRSGKIVTPGGVAAGPDRLWLAIAPFDKGSSRISVNSVVSQGTNISGAVTYEQRTEAALPAGVILRSLTASRRGAWALVHVEDPAALAAIDGGMQPGAGSASTLGPQQSQPATSAVAPADRLLKLSGNSWIGFALPVDYGAPTAAWLVVLNQDDEYPVLVTIIGSGPTEMVRARQYRTPIDHTPFSSTATPPKSSWGSSDVAPGGPSVPRLTTAPAATTPSAEGQWEPLPGASQPQGWPLSLAATGRPLVVDGQLVMAMPDGKSSDHLSLELLVLRPELEKPIPLGTLMVDGPPAAAPWALTPLGQTIALIAQMPDNHLVWARMDFRGQATTGTAKIEEFTVPPLKQMADYFILIGALVVAVVIMFVFWRRDPALSRLSLPRELVLAELGWRALAGAIDLAPCVGIAMLVFHLDLMDLLPPIPGQTGMWATLPARGLAIGLFVVHTTLSEIFTARTMGKALVGQRVTTLDGQPPNLWQALARGLLKILDLVAWLLLVLPVLSPLRQRIGDIVARTVVVAPRREESENGDEEDEG